MTALAFPVVVLALMAAVAWLGGALLFPLHALLTQRYPVFARAIPLVASLPVVAALAIAAAALLPGDPHLDQPVGCHCASSMPAWSHLCPVHPAAALKALPLALVVLALWLPARARPLLALCREPLGVGQPSGLPVLAPLTQPTAALVGWLRPTVIVDPGLWDALTERERAAVLAHERAHLLRRDPTVLMALRTLTLAGPRAIGVHVTRVWLDHAETRADALAARAVGDPLLVAEALLRCARLGATGGPVTIGWTSGSLERRVRRLLVDDGRHVAATPDVGLADVFALGALGALALGATPWVHHHVEHLLNLSL